MVDAGGTWLARGYLNRRSQICVRLLSWERETPIDTDFWRTPDRVRGLRRIGRGRAHGLPAGQRRKRLPPRPHRGPLRRLAGDAGGHAGHRHPQD
ncbi:MAG: hypothetical protein R2851_19815 [Caldilineaceae bacterium]